MTAPPAAPRPSLAGDRDTRVRARLDAMIRAGRAPGLQYLVVDASRTRFEHAAGWADVASRTPMTARTTLMAYSMSKTITACAVLGLAARGQLGLDDPLDRFVRTLYGPAVTIRHLLAHLAGIPNPIPLRWVHPAARHDTFDEQAALAAVIAAHPRLESAPGRRFRYSNIGYWLLGAVAEKVCGEPFVRHVSRQVLEPLGVGASELGYAIPPDGPHASGYLERYSLLNLMKGLLIDRELIGPSAGAWVGFEPHYLNGPAFGGLVGAASGFGKFLQDQLRPRSAVLDAAGYQALRTRQRTTAGASVPMTLGWHAGERSGVEFFYKEGGGGGFHCEMRLYPAAGIGTVLMANATQIDVQRALNALDPEFFA